MAYASSRNQRGYVQKESVWGTIPNGTGTASVAATDAFQFISLDMNSAQPINPRPDKTGSLSQVKGTAGRKSATWSMTCSLAGSGAAGTPPDIDVFLAALMGKDGVPNGTTNVTYGLEDASPSLTIWDFCPPAGVEQRCIFGAIVQRATFNFGGNFAQVTFSGEGKAVLTKNGYAGADTDGKGGLNAFPSEPSSQTTAGSAVSGYKGVITLDSVAYSTIRSGNIDIAVARELPKDGWDTDYPLAPADGIRTVTAAWSQYEDDAAGLATLIGKMIAHTTFDSSYQFGKTAGNIWTITLNDNLFDAPTYGYDATRRYINFKCQAAASSGTAKDECSIVLT